MKKTILSLVAALCFTGATAGNIVGKWKVNHLQEEKVSSRLNAVSILGGANEIEFKLNGKFFANDTVYGTYKLVGDRLVLTRDQAFVNLFMDNVVTDQALVATLSDKGGPDVAADVLIEGEAGAGNGAVATRQDDAITPEVVSELKALAEVAYANDTLSSQFGQRGNTLLLTNDDESLYFELQRLGTMAENLSEDRTIVGSKWKMNVAGLYTKTLNFGNDGILRETQIGGMGTRMDNTSYVVEKDHITIHRAGGHETYRWIMPTANKLMLIDAKGVTLITNE